MTNMIITKEMTVYEYVLPVIILLNAFIHIYSVSPDPTLVM